MRVYATFTHSVVAMLCTSLGNTVSIKDVQSATPSARVGIETE